MLETHFKPKPFIGMGIKRDGTIEYDKYGYIDGK